MSILCLSWIWCGHVTAGFLCYPAVHSHSFDRRTLWPTHRQRVEVWSLLLLSIAATLVRTAGGADAVCGRPSQLCSAGWGGGGVMMRRAMSLRHIPWLTEVVTGRGDRLGFNVDVVVGANRETGAGRPADSRTNVRSSVSVVSWRHLVVELTGMFTKNFLLIGPETYPLV